MSLRRLGKHLAGTNHDHNQEDHAGGYKSVPGDGLFDYAPNRNGRFSQGFVHSESFPLDSSPSTRDFRLKWENALVNKHRCKNVVMETERFQGKDFKDYIRYKIYFDNKPYSYNEVPTDDKTLLEDEFVKGYVGFGQSQFGVVRDTLANISSLLTGLDSGVERFDVVRSDSDTLNGYVQFVFNRPSEMGLDTTHIGDGSPKKSTIAHEFGHVIEHVAAKKTDWDNEGPLAQARRKLWRAIRDSRTIRDIVTYSDGDEVSKSMREYMLDSGECFARAFAQWVSTKLDGKVPLDADERLTRRNARWVFDPNDPNDYPGTWTVDPPTKVESTSASDYWWNWEKDDFAPIDAAMTELIDILCNRTKKHHPGGKDHDQSTHAPKRARPGKIMSAAGIEFDYNKSRWHDQRYCSEHEYDGPIKKLDGGLTKEFLDFISDKQIELKIAGCSRVEHLYSGLSPGKQGAFVQFFFDGVPGGLSDVLDDASKLEHKFVSHYGNADEDFKRQFGRALGDIDKVLSLPLDGFDPIPVSMIDASNFDGVRGAVTVDRYSNVRCLSVCTATDVHGTTLHEIGHVLDRVMYGTIRPGNGDGALNLSLEMSDMSESYRDLPLFAGSAKVFDAIRSSQRVKAIDKYEESDSHKKYLLQANECFARAFAQYIQMKNGQPRQVAKEIDVSRTPLGKRVQSITVIPQRNEWSDEDFAPILEAMDALFDDLGWLRH